MTDNATPGDRHDAAFAGHCTQCGGALSRSVKHTYCMTDLIGAALVGVPILFFIGFIILPASGGPAMRFAALLAFFLVFGLYHMVGRKEDAIIRCTECGAGQNGDEGLVREHTISSDVTPRRREGTSR